VSSYFHVPLVARIARIDDAATIRLLNATPSCGRRFGSTGPLLNRWLQRRLAVDVVTARGALPAFQPRDDPDRAAQRDALAARLGRLDADALAARDDVRALGAWVAGDGSEAEGGRRLQTVLGRLFVDEFEATPATWRAARLIDRYVRADPLRAAWWSYSGALARALRALAEPLADDTHAVHATAIAIHNLQRALATMRAVRRHPVERARMDEDRIALRCLQAPASAPRVLEGPTQLPFRARPAPAGTLVLFRLADVADGRLDAATTFGEGQWSACPADTYVPALLRAVWRHAVAVPEEAG
jgi:hypothetical protein